MEPHKNSRKKLQELPSCVSLPLNSDVWPLSDLFQTQFIKEKMTRYIVIKFILFLFCDSSLKWLLLLIHSSQQWDLWFEWNMVIKGNVGSGVLWTLTQTSDKKLGYLTAFHFVYVYSFFLKSLLSPSTLWRCHTDFAEVLC